MPYRSHAPDLILTGGLVHTVNADDLTATALGDHERFTNRDAIRSHTIGGTCATGRERIVGSLEPGKVSGLVVLKEDPLSIPAEKLKDVQPLTTMLGERWVFALR